MGALDALLEYTPRMDVANRRVTCELKLSKRVAASILFEIADGIKAAYELSFVRLYPRYDSALFSAACIDDLIETLCRSTEKIGRGFFDDCTYEYDASAATVTIRLRDGMNAAMLNSDGADRFLHDCVRQAFGLDVRFVLRRGRRYHRARACGGGAPAAQQAVRRSRRAHGRSRRRARRAARGKGQVLRTRRGRAGF